MRTEGPRTAVMLTSLQALGIRLISLPVRELGRLHKSEQIGTQLRKAEKLGNSPVILDPWRRSPYSPVKRARSLACAHTGAGAHARNTKTSAAKGWELSRRERILNDSANVRRRMDLRLVNITAVLGPSSRGGRPVLTKGARGDEMPRRTVSNADDLNPEQEAALEACAACAPGSTRTQPPVGSRRPHSADPAGVLRTPGESCTARLGQSRGQADNPEGVMPAHTRPKHRTCLTVWGHCCPTPSARSRSRRQW